MRFTNKTQYYYLYEYPRSVKSVSDYTEGGKKKRIGTSYTWRNISSVMKTSKEFSQGLPV